MSTWSPSAGALAGTPAAAAPLPSYTAVQAARRQNRAMLFAMVGGHVALALGMRLMPALATVHALVALAVGALWAGSRQPVRTIYVVAYLGGAELLWRINEARVFWEYGKYATVLLVFLVLQRLKLRQGLRNLAVIYLALLAPGTAVTVGVLGFSGETRQAISSSLSGPLALTLLVILFSGLDSRWLRLDRLVLALMAPIAGVLTLALTGTVVADDIQFGTYSNFATSAGYGPNQVSATLGLGGLLCLLLLLHEKDYRSRLLLAVLTVVFFGQTMLTFSRGGVLNVAVCIVLFGIHYLTNRRLQRALLGLTVVLGVVGVSALPWLNTWTGGYLEARYTDFDTTGRKEIAEADLEVWREHPVLGAGAGLSGLARKKLLMKRLSAHTEYTRLVAEHGVFGAVALLILLLIAFQAYRRAPTLLAKGWVAGMAGWTMASMAHVGMRVVAISLLFGLATLRWPRPGEAPATDEAAGRAGPAA